MEPRLDRKGRGPAPDDEACFGTAQVPMLRAAIEDLCWLLSRDYPHEASLKLVGDRYGLTARQRKAVQRSSCSDEARDARVAKRWKGKDLAGADVSIDGFNCIIVTESLLSGAPVFRGRDGALRDMASAHGTWRSLGITNTSVRMLLGVLKQWHAGRVRWWLDQPVSNSGRLRQRLVSLGKEEGIDWEVETVADPDRVLLGCSDVVATADARILDGCSRWVDLPAEVAALTPQVWLVDVS
ncbi:MAG TPA: DUF434 domain-containing protein [Polyangiaceae bacterium]|nr:MAG: hypothetical protein BWY17_02860 [Deltaproteobacteria bacterium ADurb.Bin207]HOT11021.1 DUF434 domain-containing protein [Polyangiaceae bacterium]HPY18854.1 DUF434 domain-containing protein [Polyangiaceae bacterium]HQF23252.1 DUF434 domain-containing protein [Polyangiaceae bacterium]HQK16703.1 DUF434 domain-containing protein [Polyangiaceae bacterium]